MSEVANRLLVFKLSFSFPNFHHLTLSSINISPISKLNYLSMKYSFLNSNQMYTLIKFRLWWQHTKPQRLQEKPLLNLPLPLPYLPLPLPNLPLQHPLPPPPPPRHHRGFVRTTTLLIALTRMWIQLYAQMKTWFISVERRATGVKWSLINNYNKILGVLVNCIFLYM